MDNPHSVLLYLRPIRLVHVRETGRYCDTIPKAWTQLFQWLDANGLKASLGRGYGLAHDNPAFAGGQNCRYDACVEIRSNVEDKAFRDLSVRTLPGGAYACRRLSGSYDLMRAAVQNVHSEFVPLPGLCFDKSRPVVSIYVDNPNYFVAGDLRADICVPVIADDDYAALRLAVNQ